MEEREVDARGLQCPRPVMMTKKALDEMGAGVLRVLVSQKVQSQNVSQLAAAAGFRAEVEELGDHYRVTVYKTEGVPDSQQPEASEEPEPPPNPTREGLTFFFGSEAVGRGEPELGRLLARLMLQTLADMERPPGCLVFMNSGVRLVCDGSPALDALRTLESKGCRILVCGTCLDFLGLVDRIRVGKVSNMYEILEAIISAEKFVAV